MPINPNNKRIFYASHAVSVINDTEGEAEIVGANAIPGVQSVSINTNYNLEKVFQLGRLATYDNFPTNPEVDVTINKALDGHQLIWNFFTDLDSQSLVGASNDTATIILHVGHDTAEAIDGPTASIHMTGCYVTSLNYNFPTDGNFTEEIKFIGNHKAIGGSLNPPPENPLDRVLRRQNFAINNQNTILPYGVSGKCINSISISADLSREAMYCLGAYAPYHRYLNFPLEITVAFDVTENGMNGASIAGPEFDLTDVDACESPTVGNGKELLKLAICSSKNPVGGVAQPGGVVYTFDFGSGAGLQSVSYSGGDTGGGSVTQTYTYLVYNTLAITYTAPD